MKELGTDARIAGHLIAHVVGSSNENEFEFGLVITETGDPALSALDNTFISLL